MNIPIRNDFQPSGVTLRKWLSTRKQSINIGTGNIPGFFSDSGNSEDTNWFIVAVAGELIGLGTTIFAGVRNGGIFLFFAVIAILMFIACDFFFAIKLHRRKGRICEIDSEIFLTEIGESNKIQKLNNERNEGRLADFFLQFGIILIGFVKIGGIVILGIFNNLIIYFPFAVIYLIVAYVHIKHTGYWFAYWSTENAIRKEFKKFAQGSFNAQEYSSIINLNSQLNLPIIHIPHQIILDNNKSNKYIIKTKGVLTDEDIINLISQQTMSNKVELFKACRLHQIQFDLTNAPNIHL